MWKNLSVVCLSMAALAIPFAPSESVRLLGGNVPFDPTSYANSHEVPLSGVTVYWSVAGSEIKMALRAQTTGFIALGLAEPTVGGMAGSDILVVSVVDGVPKVEDRYATAKSTPGSDGCQDWQLVSGEEKDGWTMVEVSRKLVTGDEQDRDIMVGNSPVDFNRVIIAKSASDTFGYHGSNRWSDMIHFGAYEPPTLDSVKADCCKYVCDVITDKDIDCKPGDKPNSPHSLLRLRNDFVIPQDEVTTYENGNYDFSGILQQVPNGVHIVGMEAVIWEETKAFVHHFTVIEGYQGGPTVWAWVPGNGPFVLPPEAGFMLHKDGGGAGANKLVMQTHFDNPSFLANKRDQSGIDVYVSDQLRQHNAGIMVLGDGKVHLQGQMVGDKRHIFQCDQSCTSGFSGPLTVFGNMFHMHRRGQQMWTAQKRNGAIVDEWRADYYDYAFENYYHRQRTIQPGDELTVTCIYKDAANVEWGLASNEEMCMDFVAYYPRQDIMAGKDCGVPKTCGTHTTGSGQREPIPFGTECNQPAPSPTPPSPTPGGSAFSPTKSSEVSGAQPRHHFSMARATMVVLSFFAAHV